LGYLLDTNIAIHLREGTTVFIHRVGQLPSKPYISVLTQVELEGGVYTAANERFERRLAVDDMVSLLPVLDFTFDMAKAYGRIVAAAGFNRRKIIDRMIAATAIVTDFVLITAIGVDFADISGLKLEHWDL